MAIKNLINRSKKAMDRFRDKLRSMREQLKEQKEEIVKTKLPEEKSQKVVVEISLWSATKVILLILGFLLLQSALAQILDTLLIFFVSLFLAAAFNPGTDWLERRLKFPRWLGIIVLYIVVLSILTIIIGGVVPIVIEQVSDMAISTKDYLSEVLNKENLSEGIFHKFVPYAQSLIDQIDQQQIVDAAQKYMESIVANLGKFASNTFSIIISVVNGVFNFILILLLTFFMVVERDSLNVFFTSLFPKKYEEYIAEKSHAVQKKVGEWVHGQMIVFFIMGLIAYIGLMIIGVIGGGIGDIEPGIVKYALTLALVVGLAEFLPYIGPTLAFITAAPVAFNDSLLIGLCTMGLYAFLQFLDGNFIVPLVMKKVVGLSPIVTIVAMLIGWQFLGVWGMILSIPVASIISVFVSDFTSRKNR